MIKKIYKRNLNIGIDIDNVIADTYPAFVEKFNCAFNKNIRYEEVSQYFDWIYVARLAGVDQKEAEIFMNDVLNSEEIHLSYRPFSQAAGFINDLAKKGHHIHYISARPSFSEKSTRKWLSRHKFMVKGAKLDLYDKEKYKNDQDFKNLVTKKHRIDIMIEDSLEIACVMEIPVILIDRPWNRGELPRHIKRVFTWDDIAEEINKIVRQPGW